ncbi:unnamed protein product [Linum trigynum]|uniref:Uncharacterized protein n=1 Tax=Linum trigynum TaxID=586398 RepID=A0AAV2CKW0_9ROSI
MGNCQAIDAAALVIQHPCGKIERMYWPVTASEIMSLNPGHYVSLIIPLPRPPTAPGDDHKVVAAATAVQFTRVKLLRPTDTLALGHAYRLVTTQEVVKVLRAKKSAKMKKQEAEPGEKPEAILSDKQSSDSRKSDSDKDFHFQFQASKQGSHRRRAAPVNPSALRSKSWRPTLHSISEATS